MPSTVQELVELGNYFAANKQWNNAVPPFIQALEAMYTRLGEDSIPLPPIPGLPESLAALGGGPVELDASLTDACIKKLREAHKVTFDIAELQQKLYVMAFESPISGIWTVVFYNQKQLLPFDMSGVEQEKLYGNGKIPTGRSYSFVLKFFDNTVESIALSQTKATQLAYSYAHLAWARVNQMLGLYHENQILNDDGVPAVLAATRHYYRALALSPDYPWALSHYGEAYRELANGWPGSKESLFQSDERVWRYVIALAYYKEAIRLNPNGFWAHAHFGAAVVNARSFVGVRNAERSPLSTLLDAWFPEIHSAKGRYDAITDEALRSLALAQQFKGNLYPWAQAYYAGALMLKCIGETSSRETSSEKKQQLALLSMQTVADAFYLQPKLLKDGFESGELYINGYFQVGLLYFWLKRPQLAWEWTRLGMGRLFDFHFLPGLQAFLGFQILVNIASQNVGVKPTERAPVLGVPLFSFVGSNFSVSGVPIPSDPIDNESALIEFVSSVFEKSCIPTIGFFLHKSIILNTNIRMGLIQACFILANFVKILNQTTRNKDTMMQESAKMVNDKLKNYMERIRVKLSLPRNISSLEDYPYSNDDMFEGVCTGKPSHHMIKELDRLNK